MLRGDWAERMECWEAYCQCKQAGQDRSPQKEGGFGAKTWRNLEIWDFKFKIWHQFFFSEILNFHYLNHRWKNVNFLLKRNLPREKWWHVMCLCTSRCLSDILSEFSSFFYHACTYTALFPQEGTGGISPWAKQGTWHRLGLECLNCIVGIFI